MEIHEAKERWIRDQVEQWIIPNCRDVEEAVAAFEFFASQQFSEHKVRFLLTLDKIRRNVDLSEKKIAETGHRSGLSLWLEHLGCAVSEIDGDFRYILNANDRSFDVLFSFEVLEHIKDTDHTSFDDLVVFNFTGVENYIREMHRVLDVGGLLILTTPNPTSLYCINEAYERREPYVYVPHVREYSPHRVVDFFQKGGFQLQHFDTMYANFYLNMPERETLLVLRFLDDPIARKDRGDVSFFVFKKT